MAAVIIALLLSAPLNLMADQTDPRLDALFGRLQTTDDAGDAALVTNLIWTIWHQSDDDRINELMRRGPGADVHPGLPGGG